SGLSQIIEVDGYLQIMSSLTLNSLSGLDNLQSVGDFLRIGDINVSTLTGLDNLSSVSGNFIVIENNDNLQNLNGLGQLTLFNGSFTIKNNSALISINGLENLTTALGPLTIENNHSLINLNSLQNLNLVGGRLLIAENDQLTDLTGLENLNSVGELSISDNLTLTSLTGLNSLTEVNGSLSIDSNFNLSNISSLANIDLIEGNLSITNTQTETLSVFENINSINGLLNISNNSQLINIEGIRNIDATTITELWIQINPMLSQCAVESVCDFLDINTGNTNIILNATGCFNRQEVEAACLLNIDENQIAELKIYPNPTNNTFEISGLNDGIIEIIDNQGRTVKQMVSNENNYSISELTSGIYFVKITSEKTSITKQLIKT